jgi:hypothetical protein
MQFNRTKRAGVPFEEKCPYDALQEGFSAILAIAFSVSAASCSSPTTPSPTEFILEVEENGSSFVLPYAETIRFAEENLAEKMPDPDFLADISPLLSSGYGWDPQQGYLPVLTGGPPS